MLIITADSEPANVLRGLEAGADGFMTKDRDPEEVVGRMSLCRDISASAKRVMKSVEERIN